MKLLLHKIPAKAGGMLQFVARCYHIQPPRYPAHGKVTGELGGLLALPPPSDPTVIDGEAKPVEASRLVDVLLVENVNDLPRFMAPKQAAQYLNVNPRLLENWRWKKCGPRFVKVGNSVRYTREDLDMFVQQGTKNENFSAPSPSLPARQISVL